MQLPEELDAAVLEQYRISSFPPYLYYIPNFISASEEESLLQSVNSVPKPKWTYLSHRRLQTHPSPLSASGLLALDGKKGLPEWLLSPVAHRMKKIGIWDTSPHKGPNHVLVNEYEPGQGIHKHEDGGAYFGMVATVSLGGSIVLEIEEKKESGGKVHRILQEPRSLLVTTGDVYTEYLHGIAEVEVDEDLRADTVANWELLGDVDAFEKSEDSSRRNKRTTRVSLTYRDVIKTYDVGNLFGKKKK